LTDSESRLAARYEGEPQFVELPLNRLRMQGELHCRQRDQRSSGLTINTQMVQFVVCKKELERFLTNERSLHRFSHPNARKEVTAADASW